MARNAPAAYRYLVRAPGARHIRVKQLRQKTGVTGARRYDTIRSTSVDPTADPAKYVTVYTKKGLSRGYVWKDQFKVTATYGTGARQNTKTWRFTIRADKSMTLRCTTCVSKAAAPATSASKPSATPAVPRVDTRGVFTPTTTTSTSTTSTSSSGMGFLNTDGSAGTSTPGLGFAASGTPDTSSVTDSSITPETGGDEDEAIVVEVETNIDGTDEDEAKAVSDELDELVDGGVVVEVDEETETALETVEGPSRRLPFDVPPAVEPYVIPAAGAAIGAFAGRYIGRASLGAIVGGVAGFFLGERR